MIIHLSVDWEVPLKAKLHENTFIWTNVIWSYWLIKATFVANIDSSPFIRPFEFINGSPVKLNAKTKPCQSIPNLIPNL